MLARASLLLAVMTLTACQTGPTEQRTERRAAVEATQAEPAPSDTAPPAPPVDASEPAPPADTAELAPAPTGVDVAVHEWGLVRYPAGEPALARTGACADEGVDTDVLPVVKPLKKKPVPKVRINTMTVDKPVLYFIPGPSFDATTRFEVEVGMAGGLVREVWPTPQGAEQPKHTERYVWSDVAVGAQACAPSNAPKASDPACTSIGDTLTCEAAELPRWIPTAANCLEANGLASPVLLYNTRASAVSARPLELVDGRLHNRLSEAVGPLWFVHESKLYRVESLAGFDSLELTQAKLVGGAGEDDFAAAIRAELLARGLTASVADDFVRAWSPLIGHDGVAVDQPPVDRPVDKSVVNVDESLPVDAELVWPWQFFAFASPELVDSLLPLRISPQPRSLVRVLALVGE